MAAIPSPLCEQCAQNIPDYMNYCGHCGHPRASAKRRRKSLPQWVRISGFTALGTLALVGLLAIVIVIVATHSESTKGKKDKRVRRDPNVKPRGDHNIWFYEVWRGNKRYLMYKMFDIREATVKITANNSQNVRSSVPLPLTIRLPQKSNVLVTFTQKDPRLPAVLNWYGTWHPGYYCAKSAPPYEYSLPFKGDFKVSQGAHGERTHAGTWSEEAIDWSMPVGTPIYAARGGTVIATRSDCTIAVDDPSWGMDCNYVMVSHGDGTYAEYVHLKHDGVLVKPGQVVKEGEHIALSGNTGYSSGPHLHFAVFRMQENATNKTIPVQFRQKLIYDKD